MITDILADPLVKKEIMDNMASGRFKLPEGESLSDALSTINKISGNNQESKFALESLSGRIESIVQLEGRPALLVKDGVVEKPSLNEWKKPLAKYEFNIQNVLPSVGRIELRNHPDFNSPHCGTGWLISDDIIVTNRHVAIYFANKSNDDKWQFRQTPFFETVKANIDFLGEYQSFDDNEFEITEILDIVEDKGTG
ncbi:hypothetical protein VU12_07135, partial [Desulfobulbus sp. US4]|nr:hypothetical protein [Desulfobulbus sp. US4]